MPLQAPLALSLLNEETPETKKKTAKSVDMESFLLNEHESGKAKKKEKTARSVRARSSKKTATRKLAIPTREETFGVRYGPKRSATRMAMLCSTSGAHANGTMVTVNRLLAGRAPSYLGKATMTCLVTGVLGTAVPQKQNQKVPIEYECPKIVAV